MNLFSKFLIMMFLLLNYINISISQVTQEWNARYTFSSISMDGGDKIFLDNMNNIYVSGPSTGNGSGYDFVTIKYSQNGIEEWVNRYNGIGNDDDIPNDMIVDYEGNICVTGSSYFDSNQNDFLTIKYSPNGSVLWIARYSCYGNQNYPTSISTDINKNIYVTGKNFMTFLTIKYDSDGKLIWVSEYPAPFFRDVPHDIAVDDSNNVYLAGESNSDCITIKYDSRGNQEWVSIYKGSANGHDFNNSIGIDSLGNVYVSGSSIENLNSFGGYLTIKYNSKGIQQWIRFYEGTANFFTLPRAMKVDKSGNVYVTGYSTESGQGYNITTIKYNTNGDTLWRVSYHNGPNDIASDIDIDSFGNTYITGRSDGNGTGDDFVTIKYNELGIQQWAINYDFSIQFGDFGRSIFVDRNGSVFVTGNSDRDIMTIKYSQLTGIQSVSEIPDVFNLEQNYPNPFNPRTVIKYKLSMFHFVSLKVYDILGNEVASLVNENKPAGSYEVVFDGSDFPSGIYFYSLSINGNVIDTKRMVLLK